MRDKHQKNKIKVKCYDIAHDNERKITSKGNKRKKNNKLVNEYLFGSFF
jgi:hypothetical protein